MQNWVKGYLATMVAALFMAIFCFAQVYAGPADGYPGSFILGRKVLKTDGTTPTAFGEVYIDSGGKSQISGNNTTATRKFFRQVGNGTVSAAPAWDTLTLADMPAGVKQNGQALTGIYQPEDLSRLSVSSNGTVTLTRNAQGDWSLNETAGGAETTYISCVVPWKQLTSGFGYELTSINIAYQVGVVDATSIDAYADGVVYAQATAPAVTNNIEGTVVDGSYDTNNNTAAKRKDHTVTSGEHFMTLTFPTPAFYNAVGGFVRFEWKAVLANTGTLKLRSVVPTYSILTQ